MISTRRLARVAYHVLCWTCVAFSVAYLSRHWPSTEAWGLMFGPGWLPRLLAVLGCVAGTMVLRALRWGIMLRPQLAFRWREILTAHTWIFFLITFSPARSGELAKLWWITNRGGRVSWASGILLIERVVDLLVLLALFAGLSLTMAIGGDDGGLRVPWWVLAGALGLYLAATFVAPSRGFRSLCVRFGLSKVTGGGEPDSMAAHFWSGVSCLRYLRTNLSTLALTLGIWCGLGAAQWIYVSGVHPGFGYGQALFLATALNLSALFSVAPANLGIWEGVALLCLRGMGLVEPEPLAVVVGLRFALLGSTALCGFLGRTVETVFFRSGSGQDQPAGEVPQSCLLDAEGPTSETRKYSRPSEPGEPG